MEEAVPIKRIQGNDTTCLVLWTHQGHLTPQGVGHWDLQYCGFEPFSKRYFRNLNFYVLYYGIV